MNKDKNETDSVRQVVNLVHCLLALNRGSAKIPYELYSAIDIGEFHTKATEKEDFVLLELKEGPNAG